MNGILRAILERLDLETGLRPASTVPGWRRPD